MSKRKKASKQRAFDPRYGVEKEPQVLVRRPEINRRQAFIVVPEFANTDPKSLIKRSPVGSLGMYRVTFVLSIPGKEAYRSELNIKSLMESGESLLIVPKGINIKVEILRQQDLSSPPEAELMVYSNSDGALSKVEITVLASSFLDAQRQTSNIVLPLLSWWSYCYDVALDITGYEVYEKHTEVTMWVFGLIGEAKAFHSDALNLGGISKPLYRTIFASYREALNSTNVFYQFLCFYKVIEGTHKIRNLRKEEVLAAGEHYRDIPERIPEKDSDIPISDPLVLESFRPYKGKKFNSVLDQFRDILRNAVAHLDPMAESLVADNFDDVTKCEKALPNEC